jgi:hypothetical protein
MCKIGSLEASLHCGGRLRVPSCAGFFGPYTVCFGVGYIYTLTLSSTLCHVHSIYVASEMTNSNLFQKIQKFPKKSKLAKIGQNWPFFFGILANYYFYFFSKLLAFLANFGQFWLILAFFWLFWKFLGFHVAYIGGTYTVCRLNSLKFEKNTNARPGIVSSLFFGK